jgi:hypothetical protein
MLAAGAVTLRRRAGAASRAAALRHAHTPGLQFVVVRAVGQRQASTGAATTTKVRAWLAVPPFLNPSVLATAG